MAPTERSMPPATMTGVKATARSPSSALNLVISKKFPIVKKLGAAAEKNAISAASTTSSAHSPLGNHRRRHDGTLRRTPRAASRSALGGLEPGGHALVERMTKSIGGDRRQDDAPLHGTLPVRAHIEIGKRRPYRRQQHAAEHGANNAPGPPRDRGTTDDNRRDHLHLQADASVARNLVETHGIEHRGETR